MNENIVRQVIPAIGGDLLASGLTQRDLAIAVQVSGGVTMKDTAAKLGVCDRTVERACRKPAMRELFLSILEDKKYTVEKHVDNYVLLTEATKKSMVGVGETAEIVTEPDNKIRLGAVNKLSDIMGLDAPKEIELTALTRAGDSELANELEMALTEIEPAQTQDGAATPQIEGTCGKSCVAGEPEE